MDKPSFLDHEPVAIGFGTSGMRALVRDLTDLAVYVSVKGALRYLVSSENVRAGGGVVLGGDLRPSTPRIMRAAAQAILDSGLTVENAGMVPTPALLLRGFLTRQPGVMVTGSHIPFDRNGIKISKSVGEVLKSDEPGILREIERVRQEEYAQTAATSRFDAHGMLKAAPLLPSVDTAAAVQYVQRYARAFPSTALAGMRIALYEHSAVGRALVRTILIALGAEVVPVGRSNSFVPVDTENVDEAQLALLERLVDEAETVGPIDAIVSTDGDSDRPLVAAVLPERDVVSGRRIRFLPGDLLGLVVAEELDADVVAVPVSANDAIESVMRARGVELHKTRIGSPYVVSAMAAAQQSGAHRHVVGWEANGGFLVGSNLGALDALPTRDAMLPIIVNLAAARAARVSLATFWSRLPPRFGRSGLIDEMPVEVSRAIMKLLVVEEGVEELRLDSANVAPAWRRVKETLEELFTPQLGFDRVVALNLVDGIRIRFQSGEVAHLRPSGNAPQLRVYANADSQHRADEIVTLALREPDGILRRLERLVT
ncbi:MAG: mannose-6-phosphate isomerase, class [Myxococcales bacterium]|nr:mannose-6-phosphate isomerase, class [Myxococcales bacterium]